MADTGLFYNSSSGRPQDQKVNQTSESEEPYQAQHYLRIRLSILQKSSHPSDTRMSIFSQSSGLTWSVKADA
jgi:hypothetical protein